MSRRNARSRTGSRQSSRTFPHIHEQTALELVSLIYDAALHPAAWKTFLERYAEAVHGECTSLFWYDLRNLNSSISCSVRSDPEDLRSYESYYAQVDVWGQVCKQLNPPSGTVFQGEQLCPDDKLEKSEYYADFLRPMNAYRELCGIIFKESSKVAAIASLRPKKTGPYEKESVLTRLLMPHLQRALQVHVRMLEARSRFECAGTALDRVPVGVVLLAGGRVTFANNAARKIAGQNDGLHLSGSGIKLSAPKENDKLRQLIQASAATAEGTGFASGGVLIATRPSMKPPYAMLVAPQRPQAFGFLASGPAAIIFITDPEQGSNIDEQVLRHAFGLTAAEARLATLLAEGRSLEEAAQANGVAVGTVRAQVKRLFEKTETHRQGELVSLIMRSSMVVPGRKH